MLVLGGGAISYERGAHVPQSLSIYLAAFGSLGSFRRQSYRICAARICTAHYRALREGRHAPFDPALWDTKSV